MKVLNLGEFGYSLVFSQSRDLTDSEITILYTKPDGIEGEWEAAIDPNDSTTFYYTLKEGDIDLAGIWVLWLFARWDDKELWTKTSFRVKGTPTDRTPEES